MKRWKKSFRAGVQSIKRLWSFGINCIAMVGIILALYRLPAIKQALCPVTQNFLSVSALPAECRPKLANAIQNNSGESRSAIDPPTEAYQKQIIEGFTVFIPPKLQQHQSILSKGLYQLEFTLEELARRVSSKQFAALQKVPIWLEYDKFESDSKIDDPRTERVDYEAAGIYYNSADWLRRKGRNPDKAGGIGIFDLPEFVQYYPSEQLELIIHELAHAYHYQVLGIKDFGIYVAYQKAKNQKLYESVKHRSGEIAKGYAATDLYEYFAELSVTYFAENYYYPFDRNDLAKYDARGYQLMQKSWGKAS